MERIARKPDEADLSAQDAPSRKGARFPRPDADHRRPAGDRRPSGTGTQAADGLTTERGAKAPRLVMLSRPGDFRALQGKGKTRAHPFISARILRTDLEMTRIGLSTGKRLGGAVVRNRVRRRLRGVLRELAPTFQPGWDILIVAHPAVVGAGHDELAEAVKRLLRRGGVVGGPTTA